MSGDWFAGAVRGGLEKRCLGFIALVVTRRFLLVCWPVAGSGPGNRLHRGRPSRRDGIAGLSASRCGVRALHTSPRQSLVSSPPRCASAG